MSVILKQSITSTFSMEYTTMLIDESEVRHLVEHGLHAIENIDLPLHVHNCPHCGIPIKYPVIARRADIEAFEKLMKMAYSVMDRCGITANLLAEIQTECYMLKLKRNLKSNEDNK